MIIAEDFQKSGKDIKQLKLQIMTIFNYNVISI